MTSNPDTEVAQAELDRAIMAAFCNVLHTSRLPPMTVMNLVAIAVGSIYREVADEHRNGSCPCGWQPNPPADMESLQTALAAAMQAIPRPDLRVVQAAGRA